MDNDAVTTGPAHATVPTNPVSVNGPPPRAHAKRQAIIDRASPFALVVVLAVVLMAFSLALPSTFPTRGNFEAMVNSQGVLLILCLAVLFPLRAGDFDLSVSSNAVLVACLTAVLTAHHGYGVT